MDRRLDKTERKKKKQVEEGGEKDRILNESKKKTTGAEKEAAKKSLMTAVEGEKDALREERYWRRLFVCMVISLPIY